MSTVIFRTILTLILFGCGSSEGPSDSSADETSDPQSHTNSTDPDDIPSDNVAADVLFDVTGVPYDITETPDGILYVSIAENGIIEWDPQVD